MLTLTLSGLHESVHAVPICLTTSNHQVLHQEEISVFHHSSQDPTEQHSDYDDCDKCDNCSCHAPLIINLFQISYNPIILTLQIIPPFNLLPEVYLSLDVPPDSVAV